MFAPWRGQWCVSCDQIIEILLAFPRFVVQYPIGTGLVLFDFRGQFSDDSTANFGIVHGLFVQPQLCGTRQTLFRTRYVGFHGSKIVCLVGPSSRFRHLCGPRGVPTRGSIKEQVSTNVHPEHYAFSFFANAARIVFASHHGHFVSIVQFQTICSFVHGERWHQIVVEHLHVVHHESTRATRVAH